MSSSRDHEIFVAVLFVIALLLFINPWELLWMPQLLTQVMMAGLLVIFSVYASFVWQEKYLDEREERHGHFAGKIGYLAGFFVLMIGIFFQIITQEPVDKWILIAMAVMVSSKIFAHIWASWIN